MDAEPSVRFLAHKEKLNQHAFLYANDYLCEGQVYSQPTSLPLYPKSPWSLKLFFKRNIVGNRVHRRGVSKSRCLITSSPPRRTTTCFCVWS